MKSLGIFFVVLIATIILFAVIGSSAGSSGAGAGVLVAILLIIYLLPSFIAYSRRHPSCHAILALNLLLGWTLLGWVVSIVWALKSYKSNVQVVLANPNQINVASPSSDQDRLSKYD
jgi:RsiW-degrading membrane proteinase PrsW (M82 family)